MTEHHVLAPRRGGAATGCLIVLAILVLALIGGGVYVYMNWKGWAAAGVQAVAREVVNNSDLPDDQKTAILGEITTLTEDFKAGKVSLEELQRVGEAVAESPLIPLAGVAAARQKYIEPSDMTEEEKAAAIRALQRFARGVHEKKIPAESIEDVVKPITTLRPDGQWELKEKPTRLELDQFVENARSRADAAEIPDEPFDLNIAEELKKAIASARGTGGSN